MTEFESHSVLPCHIHYSGINRKLIDSHPNTLESGIDVGQGITIGPGKFVKKNKHRAMNNCRA